MRMTDEQKFVLLELHEAYLTYLDRRELAQEVRVIFIIRAAFSQNLVIIIITQLGPHVELYYAMLFGLNNYMELIVS